ERRFARQQRHIGIGPCRQQLLGDGRVGVLGGGRIERRRTVFVGGFRICASSQQHIGHRHVPAGGRQDQRGPALGADILLPVQDGLDGGAVALLRGSHQRQIAGVGGKRRAGDERQTQHARQK